MFHLYKNLYFCKKLLVNHKISDIYKPLLLCLAFFLFHIHIFSQGVAIGDSPQDPDDSAILDLQSIEKGFLPPRMAQQQRDAIANPVKGLMIYNTTEECINVFNGTEWYSFCSNSIFTLPIVETSPITNISTTSATSGGIVYLQCSSPVTSKGIVWSSSETPTLEYNDGYTTNGTGVGEFGSNMMLLIPQTNYFVRAYATNSAGTSYGNQVKFTTLNSYTPQACLGAEQISDVDGNIYNTIKIGEQCWMKENLRTTRFNEGTTISLISDNNVWNSVTFSARCLNGNISTNEELYGFLYNWYAVSQSGICPEGWRVPSDSDWDILRNFADPKALGNNNIAGNLLKSCRQINSPVSSLCNTSEHPRWNAHAIQYGTDDFGFSALPGGHRLSNGSFSSVGTYAYFWTGNQTSETEAWFRGIGFGSSIFQRSIASKQNGYSVRCIKE